MSRCRTRLTSWRWAWRALWMGWVCTGVGTVGAAVLAQWSEGAALAFASVYGLLLCMPIAICRLGSAGMALGLLVCAAAIGTGYGVRQAQLVTQVDVIDIATVSQWPAGARAVRVPGVVHQPALRGAAHWTTTSGINHKKTEHYVVAVALAEVDGGPIVAFECRGGYAGANPDGTVLLLLTEQPTTDQPCMRPIAAALEASRAAGRPVTEGADLRVVSVYTDVAALRSAHGLDLWLRLCVGMLALYSLAVLVFQREGARSLAS